MTEQWAIGLMFALAALAVGGFIYADRRWGVGNGDMRDVR